MRETVLIRIQTKIRNLWMMIPLKNSKKFLFEEETVVFPKVRNALETRPFLFEKERF